MTPSLQKSLMNLLIVTREFMVSALRLVVAGKGTVVPAGFAGKLKTALEGKKASLGKIDVIQKRANDTNAQYITFWP